MNDKPPHLLLIWPYGVVGAESIPMCMAFLVPQAGKIIQTTVLDCSLLNIHPMSDKFIEAIKLINPTIVGISSWSQNWYWTQRTIAALRDIDPNLTIITGGPHVTATQDLDRADYALLGEAEYTLPKFITALYSGAGLNELASIPGFRYFNQSAETKLPHEPIKDLDSLGLPNYDAMLLRMYQDTGTYRYRTGEQKQAPILATRGCPFECSFCSAPVLSGRTILKHSIPYLLELLLHLRKEFDVTHVNIVDDNFTFVVNYAKKFCEMVLQNRDKLGPMTFATPNGIRVERSDAEMFKMMKAAGWSRVIFAPESGSQRMVDIMAKHLDLDVIPSRMQMARDAGLEIEAFFIMNYPGETAEDVELTRKFIERNKFDHISLHIFKPLPHTPIWRELVSSGLLPPDHIIGRYDEIHWLANGRKIDDIKKMVMDFQIAAGIVAKVA